MFPPWDLCMPFLDDRQPCGIDDCFLSCKHRSPFITPPNFLNHTSAMIDLVHLTLTVHPRVWMNRALIGLQNEGFGSTLHTIWVEGLKIRDLNSARPNQSQASSCKSESP